MGVVEGQEEAVNQSMTWFSGEAQRNRVAAREGGERSLPTGPQCPKEPWRLDAELRKVWDRVLDFIYGLQAALNSHRPALPFLSEPRSELAF